MSINKEVTSELPKKEIPKNSYKLFFTNKIPKKSKSPDHIKSLKRKTQIELTNSNQLQTSMISLNKSNISVQKIKFNKKNYEQYMFQKRYLISKTEYHKIISNLSDIEKRIQENKEIIDALNNNLNSLKETKKKKKEEIIELLSNKESLEEIYQNKITKLKNNNKELDKEKNTNVNGQNINNENINDNGEEHTNPNTNDSNNSNEENKNNENDNNESHKKKESSSSSSSLSSKTKNQIEIKLNEMKKSDQKRYEEQVNLLLDELVPKRDDDFNNKLKKKLNLAFQAFFCEVNSPENEIQNSISNFFLRISLFLSNQTMGNISEKTANILLRELMKINSIEEEINEILKFLNKKYKDSKKELKEKIKIFNEKNENLIVKKKSYKTKKEELKNFMEENKEKFFNENNKISLAEDNSSFISDDNNCQTQPILYGLRNEFKKHSVQAKKINFVSLNNSRSNFNKENDDMNISKDMIPSDEHQVVDNLNKYLINSYQIKRRNKNREKNIERNKNIILHKTYLSNKDVNGSQLFYNNDNNIVQINSNVDESKNRFINNSEAIGDNQIFLNKKRIDMKIVYRNSKLKNNGKKTNSVVIHNSSNLQDLLSAKKNPNSNKIIFLKDKKSNSFRDIKDSKSPSKITSTKRHNHIFFQREEIKTELFSKSPNFTNNNKYTSKTNNIPYQGKIIPLSKGNIDSKKIELTKIERNNVYSTRYDNRLKILTQGIKESFCYFKFYKENHVEYNPLDELLKTPENLDYVEGYISIDVSWHKFKIIPKIYKNKITNYEQLVNDLSKEINISELNSIGDYEYGDNNCLGIELKDIIDVVLSKEMKDTVKIYNAYVEYVERQDKIDMNKFINTREVRDIHMEPNDKMKAALCKYFIFSLKFKIENSPKIEFIFINYDQFNLWYNCLQYIIKINNQTPKLINIKTYNAHGSPNKKNI